MTTFKRLQPFEYDGGGSCHCGGTIALAEIRGVYDGGLFFLCLADETHVAHRWTDEYMRGKAERVWQEWDAIADTSPLGGDDTTDSTVDDEDA